MKIIYSVVFIIIIIIGIYLYLLIQDRKNKGKENKETYKQKNFMIYPEMFIVTTMKFQEHKHI